MDKKKKTIVFTAIFALTMVAIILFSLTRPASPLAKWIDVGIHCEETGEHVQDGLAVNLFGMGYDVTEKTVDGHVLFGSGLVDGTYDLSWFWGEPYLETVTIDCSEITWYFDFNVPNPEIYKELLYDTPYGDYPPAVGVEVSLYEDGSLKASQLTNATGWVHFDGSVVTVCRDYTLGWMWGGIPYSTDVIHFGYDDLGRLSELVWQETNYVPAKSGGGI